MANIHNNGLLPIPSNLLLPLNEELPDFNKPDPFSKNNSEKYNKPLSIVVYDSTNKNAPTNQIFVRIPTSKKHINNTTSKIISKINNFIVNKQQVKLSDIDANNLVSSIYDSIGVFDANLDAEFGVPIFTEDKRCIDQEKHDQELAKECVSEFRKIARYVKDNTDRDGQKHHLEIEKRIPFLKTMAQNNQFYYIRREYHYIMKLLNDINISTNSTTIRRILYSAFNSGINPQFIDFKYRSRDEEEKIDILMQPDVRKKTKKETNNINLKKYKVIEEEKEVALIKKRKESRVDYIKELNLYTRGNIESDSAKQFRQKLDEKMAAEEALRNKNNNLIITS
jgi:hypothetical protein